GEQRGVALEREAVPVEEHGERIAAADLVRAGRAGPDEEPGRSRGPEEEPERRALVVARLPAPADRLAGEVDPLLEPLVELLDLRRPVVVPDEVGENRQLAVAARGRRAHEDSPWVRLTGPSARAA